jgi:hypothetical protein
MLSGTWGPIPSVGPPFVLLGWTTGASLVIVIQFASRRGPDLAWKAREARPGCHNLLRATAGE